MALSALTGLNALLGDFGLGAAAIRGVALAKAEQDFSKARRIVGSVATASFTSALLFGFPVMLFFNGVFRWSRLGVEFQGDAYWATLFSILSFIATSVSSPWRATYNALERYDLLSGLDTGFGLLSGLGGIGVLMVMPTMASLAEWRFGLSILRLSTDCLLLRGLLRGTVWPTWSWNDIQPMFRFGLWVWLGNQGNLLLGRLVSLILTTYLGSNALPYYELPQRLFTQIHSALANQSQFLFPMLSSYGNNANEQIVRINDRLRWLVAVASGVIYCVLALIGPWVLSALVSPEFSKNCRPILYLVCVQGFFQAQDIIPYYTSFALGLGHPNSMIQLCQGLLVALTAFFLVPRLGAVGAGLAQLWVVIAVIFHQIWVRKIVSPGLSNLSWIRSFDSPFAMIITWLAVGLAINTLLDTWPRAAFVSVTAGGIVGIGLLMMIERFGASEHQRWSTLCKILAVPFARSKQQ